jgi:two-component sensor histidine kinase
MFLILTLALLPLGAVALFASLQAIRAADMEKDALLRIGVTQSARKLATDMLSDQSALRLAVNALADGSGGPGQCYRIGQFLSSRANIPALFYIYDRDGRKICGSAERAPQGVPIAARFKPGDLTLLPASGYLVSRTTSADDRLVAISYYSRQSLSRITDPATALQNRNLSLHQGSAHMWINGTSGPIVDDRRTVSARVGNTDLALMMSVSEPPVTLARTLSLFLPLLMWFAAAAIGWFVVNRLLIRPLVLLRRAVADYLPGQVLEPLQRVRTPALEIAALGDTFRAISEEVASHEAEMAASLERQRKLTREVHHRVKNNLQIIASLINLHARAATAVEATEAYASIQRRVDALSVVHRNHFAELEENRGVGVRALVSELSASLRGTAPSDARRFAIQIDSDDLHVSQDVAVPVAFLLTELVELAMLAAPDTGMRISVRQTPDPARALICVESPGLRGTLVTDHLHDRFDRVLTGLSRQLRSPMEKDDEIGRYCITIAVAL